jgi:hypothetical protein
VPRALATISILVVLIVSLLLPAAASARPCGITTANDKGWIVYTGDSKREKRKITCRKARRIARGYIENRYEPGDWECRHTRRRKDCRRGGTYIDEFGNELPRYLIGWHRGE